MRDKLQQESASLGKYSIPVLNRKGMQLNMPVDHSREHGFCHFSEQSFKIMRLIKKLL
jgi:hypothetical protein